jgi:hypothetical protein
LPTTCVVCSGFCCVGWSAARVRSLVACVVQIVPLCALCASALISSLVLCPSPRWLAPDCLSAPAPAHMPAMTARPTLGRNQPERLPSLALPKLNWKLTERRCRGHHERAGMANRMIRASRSARIMGQSHIAANQLPHRSGHHIRRLGPACCFARGRRPCHRRKCTPSLRGPWLSMSRGIPDPLTQAAPSRFTPSLWTSA